MVLIYDLSNHHNGKRNVKLYTTNEGMQLLILQYISKEINFFSRMEFELTLPCFAIMSVGHTLGRVNRQGCGGESSRVMLFCLFSDTVGS